MLNLNVTVWHRISYTFVTKIHFSSGFTSVPDVWKIDTVHGVLLFMFQAQRTISGVSCVPTSSRVYRLQNRSGVWGKPEMRWDIGGCPRKAIQDFRYKVHPYHQAFCLSLFGRRKGTYLLQIDQMAKLGEKIWLQAE